MKKLLFLLLTVCISANINAQISETRYDYTELAQQIASNCNSKTEQAHNIYQWICENIEYDTTYKVLSA